MNDNQSLTIQNQLDIIEARMRVRTLAREAGLDLFDQARISLAASTLAIILGMENASTGQISMCSLKDGQRAGVQVVCTQETSVHDLAPGVLDDARRMVDELYVEQPPEGGVRVVMIKWAGRPRRSYAYEGVVKPTPAGN